MRTELGMACVLQKPFNDIRGVSYDGLIVYKVT
jgi:hypothetical protein